jgi:hypothetical protein
MRTTFLYLIAALSMLIAASVCAADRDTSDLDSAPKNISIRSIALQQTKSQVNRPDACTTKLANAKHSNVRLLDHPDAGVRNSIVSPDDPFSDDPWDGSFYNPLDDWSDWQNYFYDGNDISTILCRRNKQCLRECNGFCSERTDYFFEQCMAEAMGRDDPADRENAALWCVVQAVAYRAGCGGLCV